MMPKAELHLHLDGCLRLQTIADLARQQGLTLPVPRDRLAEICVAPDVCQDLVQVLSYFATPLAVLQTPEALTRVTYELCEDVGAENVQYVEIRFAPSLHRERGMSRQEAIAAVVQGWEEGQRAFGLTGGIILCAMRHLPSEETMAVAQAGIPFLGQGVVGFDLAGDEANYPILLHREPLLWAKGAGYGMTAHAGEAAGAQSVRDAVEVIGVSRIGHGVRAGEDAALLPVLRDLRIVLDMCPTSNIQTCAVPSLADHPAPRYFRYGIPVTINTDNRTVANTSETQELSLGYHQMGFTLDELAAMTLGAVEAGFAERSDRQELQRRFQREMAELGIQPRT
jgi:adenosine deaminase